MLCQACVRGYAHQGPGGTCLRCPRGEISPGVQQLMGPLMALTALAMLTAWLLRPLYTKQEERLKKRLLDASKKTIQALVQV